MTQPRRLRLVAEPLPECLLCEQPVRRSVAERLGGLCSTCAQGFSRAARMLPPLRPAE